MWNSILLFVSCALSDCIFFSRLCLKASEDSVTMEILQLMMWTWIVVDVRHVSVLTFVDLIFRLVSVAIIPGIIFLYWLFFVWKEVFRENLMICLVQETRILQKTHFTTSAVPVLKVRSFKNQNSGQKILYMSVKIKLKRKFVFAHTPCSAINRLRK